MRPVLAVARERKHWEGVWLVLVWLVRGNIAQLCIYRAHRSPDGPMPTTLIVKTSGWPGVVRFDARIEWGRPTECNCTNETQPLRDHRRRPPTTGAWGR